MRLPALATTALLVAVLAGCGSAEDPAPAGSPTSSGGFDTVPGPSPTAPDPSSTPTTPPDSGPDMPVDLQKDPRVIAALEDARGRAGIVPTDVVIAGYSAVTWNDGSLGCPKKGESYTQMMVEGELLLLRADQRLMAYHAAKGKDFEYCANPSDGYTVDG